MSPEFFVEVQMAHVVLITTKYFVRALTDLDHNCSGISGQFRNIVERNADRIADRFVLVENQIRKESLHFSLRDHYLVMMSVKIPGDASCRVKFIEVVGISKTNSVRFHRT